MEPVLTLANIPLDLQITICIFLHPSDILALRKTSKAFEFSTRQRMVWVDALHRVCLHNALFLPSFPIPDMSDLELERAAMAPHRWIELCGAFQKQDSNDSTNLKMLSPRTTRTIEHEDSWHFFIVPGGRYLVSAGNGLFVWDLGYVSTANCELVASVGLKNVFEFLDVQAGKGLVILSSYTYYHLSIFEIYPQSEIPSLTQIAHLDWSFPEFPAYLLPDSLICRVCHEDGIAFRVMDYRTNYSTCFSAHIDKKIRPTNTRTTKTAIMVVCIEGVLIWAIPALSPQSSDLRHFLDINSTHMPPIFKIPFPDGIAHTYESKNLNWMTVSSWYFGSLEFYFDALHASKLQRFKIIFTKPDLSDASLHFINMSEITSRDFKAAFRGNRVCETYMICEDALVYFWGTGETWGTYAGLTSAPFTNFVMRWNGQIDSLCPTSGRLVYCTDDSDESYILGRRKYVCVVDLF